MDKHEAKVLCKEHMHRYVRVQMADGALYDGFVEHVDDEHVYLAVPEREDDFEEYRGFFPGFGLGYGYPYGYGYGYPYGYPYGYGYGYPYGFGFGFPFFRPRFRRFGLPLGGLLGLSLLPFI